jgi:hypothetical protein
VAQGGAAERDEQQRKEHRVKLRDDDERGGAPTPAPSRGAAMRAEGCKRASAAMRGPASQQRKVNKRDQES